MNRKELINKLHSANVVSIIGMCKNSGKTTVLNALISCYKEINTAIGLTSTGIECQASEISKPLIYAPCGTLIASAMLSKDATIEIIYSSGIMTPQGEVVIYRLLTDGYVCLAGPSDNESIKYICDKLLAFGAQKVLIDGAASRIANSASSVADSTILCTGAALNADMQMVLQQTSHIFRLMTIPLADDTINKNDSCYISGLVTDSDIINCINSVNKPKSIIIDDPSKLFITLRTLSRVQLSGISLYASKRTNLVAVAINPQSNNGYYFDKEEFRRLMADNLEVAVINVEDCEC